MTIILLNLAEHRLILAYSAYGLVGEVSGDIPGDFTGQIFVLIPATEGFSD